MADSSSSASSSSSSSSSAIGARRARPSSSWRPALPPHFQPLSSHGILPPQNHPAFSSQDFRTHTLPTQDFRKNNPDSSPHYPSGDARRQWRPVAQPAATQPGHARRPRPAHTQAGSLPPELIEASRAAVEVALRDLPVRTQQANVVSSSRRDGNRQREAPKYGITGAGSTPITRVGVSSEGAERTESVNVVQNVLRDKTNVPQLVRELEEKLSRGQIECMICYDVVKRDAAVWSCAGCYSIFHIACVRKWARAPISADFSLSASNQVTVGNWRCPGCQSPQFVSAGEIKYTCFCGQVLEPQVDYYMTPHSCGGPCKKPLNSGRNSHCKHICTMQCHPGPCPPCNALAAPESCPCGKTSRVRRCSEAKIAKSCAQPCGHQLSCGRHYCAKICHEDSCGNCDAILTVKCFCGQKTEAMECGKMDLQGEVDWESGVFSCQKPCSNRLQCGRHSCIKKCHPGQCGECELSPGTIQTCPCGKVSIHELLGVGNGRKSCTDPLPLCGQSCGKLLPCGKHVCKSRCHIGECPPCDVLVDQNCRCNSSSQTVPCYKTLGGEQLVAAVENDEGLFLCNRKCGKKKNCGRHRCSNKCCPLANDENGLLSEDNNPHLCTLPCGKKLRCGQHTCQELCHNGYCPPCLESTFTELSCACGKTSIPPPVPCGTPPPSCPHPCSRPQPCGHSAMHTCHFGECAPCTVSTSKECVGSHVILRNVPCGSRDIKCNKLCGKTRQCGLHACARICHLPPCDVPLHSDDGTIVYKSCGQECGAPRWDCQHVCVAPCHPSAPCPETRCKFPVTITCSCGRLSETVPCDAGKTLRGSDALELTSFAKLSLQPVEGKARVPLGQRKLACDEECAKLEKRRILADAFGITAAVDSAISAESVQAGSEALKELVRKEPQWILAVEERFKYLVLGTKSINSGPIRVHVFGSLAREKRDVLRQIAERWNLTVSAVGREPRRFLTVHVNVKSRAPTVRDLIMGKLPLPLAGQAQAPPFNPAVDMDPRLVVGFYELPRDADISTVVLRFGGECELVWLNDKNALAIFADMARAATAMRRVDHSSVYSGASKFSLPASISSVCQWGASEQGRSTKLALCKKTSGESSWIADAWGEEWGRPSGQPNTAWVGRSAAITTSQNPWGALENVEAQTGHVDFPALTVNKSTSSRDVGDSSMNSGIREDTRIPVAVDDWEDLDE